MSKKSVLQWFAQGLGKGQPCVGSASLTSHHLPTSIISVKEDPGGEGKSDRERGWHGCGWVDTTLLAWMAFRRARAEGLQLHSSYHRSWWQPGWNVWVTSVLWNPPRCEGNGWMNWGVCLYTCENVCVCGGRCRCAKEVSSFPGLRSVKHFDLLKCFLQPWS